MFVELFLTCALGTLHPSSSQTETETLNRVIAQTLPSFVLRVIARDSACQRACPLLVPNLATTLGKVYCCLVPSIVILLLWVLISAMTGYDLVMGVDTPEDKRRAPPRR